LSVSLKQRVKSVLLDVRLPANPRRYSAELDALLSRVAEARDEFFRQTVGLQVRGHDPSFAELHRAAARRLYSLLRETQPETVVETGVCNGVSTAVVLEALHRNGRGRLYSIDLPEHAGEENPEVWEGKLGAVIPRGKDAGWLVPDQLRSRWEFQEGRSQDLLPPLLDQLAPIDVFIHDSEHSYECMSFELAEARRAVRPGGMILCDDASWNPAFQEFAAGERVIDLGGGMRGIVTQG
jgi:predicted O-methyltransferase YrrM